MSKNKNSRDTPDEEHDICFPECTITHDGTADRGPIYDD